MCGGFKVWLFFHSFWRDFHLLYINVSQVSHIQSPFLSPLLSIFMYQCVWLRGNVRRKRQKTEVKKSAANFFILPFPVFLVISLMYIWRGCLKNGKEHNARGAHMELGFRWILYGTYRLLQCLDEHAQFSIFHLHTWIRCSVCLVILFSLCILILSSLSLVERELMKIR